MTVRPDPTMHATAKLAMQAPPEKLAYTVMLGPDFSQPDALCGRRRRPGIEFLRQNRSHSDHAPLAGHAFLERRYLIVPGMRSSRLYVIDTKPDPTGAKIHKIIEPEEDRRDERRDRQRFIGALLTAGLKEEPSLELTPRRPESTATVRLRSPASPVRA